MDKEWNVAVSADTNPKRFTYVKNSESNLTYIEAGNVAHRANAYPKLVEALRVALLALGNEGHHPGISKPLTDGLNLLSEIGEKV